MKLPKKQKKVSKTKLKKKCDILFSKIVRARDKRCLKCGSTNNLQCSHLINRTNLAHRWDLKSAFTLCYKCHICWWHKEPLDANMWLAENYPDMNIYYWEHKNDLEANIDYEKIYQELLKKV